MPLYGRTDLAVESATREENLPQGVEMHEENAEGIRLTHVKITTESAGKLLGRERGHYITLELPPVSGSVESADEVTRALAKALEPLLPEGPVLVVGLGNEQMTPDALGPRTARRILATRHLPAQLAAQTGLTGLRPVAAISPGVLGQTGIESGEVIRSLVRDLQVCAVIAVDALASRSLARLGCTIQLADSGISPGSGVQNARKELSEKTLGVPVISIGIPTVTDGATLAAELLEELGISADTLQGNTLSQQTRSMMITPREIDAVIDRGARQLSLAINCALQPQLTPEEILYLVS